MSTGRITLYLAVSVDGHVADADGSVEWLEAFESEPTDPNSPALAHEETTTFSNGLVELHYRLVG